MEDIRGIVRGKCSLCTCDGFTPDIKVKITCSKCNHPPAKHERLQDRKDRSSCTKIQLDGAVDDTDNVSPDMMFDHQCFDNSFDEEEEDSDNEGSSIMDDSSDNSSRSVCSYSGCNESTYFDLNTGYSSEYCEVHYNQRYQGGRSLQSLYTTNHVPRQVNTCKLPGCFKPCFINDKNGKVSEFCCRSHMTEFQQHQHFNNVAKPQQSVLPHGVLASDSMKCKNPTCSRQRHQDSQKLHDFCGLTCRDHCMQQLTSSNVSPQNVKQATVGMTAPSCLLPGCKLPQYYDPSNGELKIFCGKQHKNHAASLVLLELSNQATVYQETRKNFIQQWSHNKSHPPTPTDICGIYQIFNPRQANIFRKYANSLNNSKVEQYYHGTSVKCDVLNQRHACTNDECGLCGISKKGFDRHLIKSNIRFTRFGKGFYLAPNSSKCHDYTQGIIDYRVMLLCDVAPGNKYTVQSDKTTLKAPPQGYDSVYGASGGNLNFDEIVLYRSESILPKYAIVYRRDGIGKIAS